MDGIPIGSYVLRPSAAGFSGDEPQLPQREIEILDDFLFEQNLELPFVVDTPPSPTEVSQDGRRAPASGISG